MSHTRGSTVARGLALFAIGGWLVFQIFAVSSYGFLPQDDYYGLISRLCDEQGFLDTPRSFYEARINQHRVTLPALLWRLNVAATGGDARVTGWLALVFLGGILWICIARLPRHLPTGHRWLATFLLAWAVLGAHHAYNLAKSFGGTHTFLADLLALAAVSVFLGFPDRPESSTGTALRSWGLVLALGVAGLLSFSSALMLWPTLAFACWWLGRPKRDWLGVMAGSGLSVALFMHGWKPSAGGLPEPLTLAEYLMVFLGALPQLSAQHSLWIGLVGILTALMLSAILWRSSKPGDATRHHTAFWLILWIYACGNGALAGLGRAAAGGADQALAPRYALFTSLFWVSLAILTVLAWPTARARHATAAAVLTVLLGVATVHGAKSFLIFRDRAHWQPVLADQLQHDAWDLSLLRITVTPFPKALVGDKPLTRFKAIGHVPWNRAPRWPDRQLEAELVGEETEGSFTEVVVTSDPDIQRVSGWVPRGAGWKAVVFADEQGRQRSLIHLWPHLHSKDREFWSGIVSWHDEWKRWTPFAVDGEGQLHPIRPARHVAEQWQRINAKRRDDSS